MIRALLHSADHLISVEGGWWILALNSILLIPVVFAVFFYPVPVLIGVGAAGVLAVAAVGLVRAVRAHHHHRS